MFYRNQLNKLTKILKFNPEKFEGQQLLLRGRVLRIRDKGKLIWFDILFEGQIYQAFVNDTNDALLTEAKKITAESVVVFIGILHRKPENNPKIDFGHHELVVEQIQYLSVADPLPFNPHFDESGDAIMQQYRFLTLRKTEFYKNLQKRSKITNFIRNYLASVEFMEIETPTLVKSTPEGARDFLVPSRIHKGEFYALPQSPQLYKQVLMQSGIEKYFQIARCYRDEALRGDRQLEFTQIDIEAAFYNQFDMRHLVVDMITKLFVELEEELVWENEHYFTPNISYEAAMIFYGTDKPDLRFSLELNHSRTGIYLYVDKLMTGKERADIFKWVSDYALTLRLGHETPFSIWTSNTIDKIKSPENGILYGEICDAHPEVKKEGQQFTIFFLQDANVWTRSKQVNVDAELNYANLTLKLVGELRNYIGRTYLMDKNTPHAACWIFDFPMFEYSDEQVRHVSMHHPFTRPSDVAKFKAYPYKSTADAYDLVIDGVEVGGGSVRIHEPELQKKVFELLGITDYADKFGGLLTAYKYGAVPHAGLALGLDRLCTFFGTSKKIGDYIAFPKNMQGYESMFSCPSTIDAIQLKELNLNITEDDDSKIGN